MSRCPTRGLLPALCGLALSCAASAAAQTLPPLSLMPMPRSVQQQPGWLPIEQGFAIKWQGRATPLLQRAAARFRSGVARLAGAASGLPARPPVTLLVSVRPDPGFLTIAQHEHYHLAAGAGGVRLDADGPAGVLDGFSTLLELVRQGPSGLSLPLVSIDDAPRFVWRGLMIDVARHFMSLPALERQIDAMERVKLDVLHLHLSDAQGFRVESKLYPRLQQIGSHGQYYTQGEIRALVAYAADRGIRIVPEFDLPGHALALLQAYPAFAASKINDLPPTFDLNRAAIDPTNPAALRMVSRLYSEMAGLFPDAYFHAGGDEVSPDQWTGNPRIVRYMQRHHIASTEALQARFTAEIERVLARDGKTMVGWDEVIEAPVPSSVVVDVWRSSKFIARAAKAGHPVIVSAGYYLDLLQPAAQHYLVDPLDPRAIGLSPDEAAKARAAGDPRVDDFSRDPNATLSSAEATHVLGGEAALWTEIVSEEMLDGRLWPRTAAIAERFWSQASVRDVADMQRRLDATEDRLCALGLDAQADRLRMVDRLVPGGTEPVLRLLGAVAPGRNYTLHQAELADRGGDHPLLLEGLADIADPDAPVVRRFAQAVRRYLGGDHGAAAAIRLQLDIWRDNEAAYQAVAADRAPLAAALPVSRDLGGLAAAGLAALGRLEGGAADPGLASAAVTTLIARNQDLLARADTMTANQGPTPADGLLLPVAGPVADLVAAARKLSAPVTAPQGGQHT